MVGAADLTVRIERGKSLGSSFISGTHQQAEQRG